MKSISALVTCLPASLHNRPEQIPVYEELARQHGLLMTVGTDYHGFNGDDYVAPKQVIDIRYLEKLGSRVEWPAVEQADWVCGLVLVFVQANGLWITA